MLQTFEMKNYKNFRKWVKLDFTKVGGYKFNADCVNNQLISKMIIYDRNATGKTNLGSAIFDIGNMMAFRLYPS